MKGSLDSRRFPIGMVTLGVLLAVCAAVYIGGL